MPLYHVRLSARSEEGEVSALYAGPVTAASPQEARQKAMDAGWDDRLDSASCRPVVRVRPLRPRRAPGG
jgi:hypothetical protein